MRFLPLLIAALLCVCAPDAFAQNRADVVIESGSGAIRVRLPLTSVTGKVRPKRRAASGLGEPVAPTKTPLDAGCYLEWQIGYDTPLKDAPDLTPGVVFQRNGVTKYGHELSTLLLDARQLGIVSRDELAALRKSLDGGKAGIEETEDVSLEKVAAPREKLPAGFEELVEKSALFVKETPHGRIEIRIQKKQRAVGDQAMLYVCLPTSLLRRADGSPRPPVPAKTKEQAVYVFDKDNAGFLLDIVRAFGVASRQHNEDMRAILDDIIAQ
jgi:hypothetical protein